MNEHVAPTVVGFNEAVASFAIKKFHHARLRHRETPFPNCSAAGPTHGGSAGHSQSGKASAADRPQSLRRPPQEAERHCQCVNYTPTAGLWKEAIEPPSPGGVPISQSSRKPPSPTGPRMALRAGNRAESSFSSVQGGLTITNPAPLSRF